MSTQYHAEKLKTIVDAQPFPLLFATVSGAHLYGFPSPDSDYDIRGAHILPPREMLGLDAGQETIQSERITGGLELDLVTHDIKKFFGLMLKKNGYVLEQLMSPLVVHTSSGHEELKSLAPACITRHHSHHYLGFGQTQWKLWEKASPRRVKPLLYVYRVLLTGIHLVRSGQIEANLLVLNEEYKLPFIPDLVAHKLSHAEKSTLPQIDVEFHRSEFERLIARLETAGAASALPETTSAKPALNDLLLRLRLPDNLQ